MSADPRRRLPSVDQVLQRPEVRALQQRFGRERVVGQVRAVLEEARGRAGGKDTDDLLAELPARLEREAGPSLVPVINATGVIIHTNLGRAPISPEAAARVAEVARSYSNLEFDLGRGERGQREVHAEGRLRSLLGAEAGLVVNNNAAAVLLAVNTFAEGREVLVSRGELVEIGGSFRIPDVLRKGGARLREVGTTNRTRLSDFRDARGPETAMILKVHPSNFRILGFTESPTRAELAGLAREADLPFVEDLGSGLLAPLPPPLHEEVTAGQALAAGVDIVTFSGDKLLGGPQAGLVAGSEARVAAMRANPLYRALRVDKMTLAALDVVLRDHASEIQRAELPVLRMLLAGQEEIRARAEAAAAAIKGECPDAEVRIVKGVSAVGGGAAPLVELPTWVLRISVPGGRAQDLAAALRLGAPAVVGRVAEDALFLDLRTVLPSEEPALCAAVAGALLRRG